MKIINIVMITSLGMLSLATFAEDEGNSVSNRIDFGNSYVNGQSIKSGAVYLMNRKKNEITSMLKRRENYRSEILDEYPEYRQETRLNVTAENTTVK